MKADPVLWVNDFNYLVDRNTPGVLNQKVEVLRRICAAVAPLRPSSDDSAIFTGAFQVVPAV
jgi:hypothetical protein